MSPSGDFLGYARVSSRSQTADLQVDALVAIGCSRVFVDHASGVRSARPELSRVLDYIRPNDTLVVWRLDRLGRSLRELVEIVTDLERREVGFRSLHESIDTTTPGGRLVFHVFASLAEFERDLIRERTSAGLASARARGRKGGRPTVMTPQKVRAAKALLAEVNQDGGHVHSVADVARALHVSRASVYRAIQRGDDAPVEGVPKR